MVKLALVVSVAGGLLCACSGDPLDDDEHIAGWANSASALGVYTNGYEPLAVAHGDLTFIDPACPAVSQTGVSQSVDKVTIAGDGCVNSEGDQFFGSATVLRTPVTWDLAMDEYGHARDGAPVARVSGTFYVAELDIDRYSFEVDIASRGGLDMDIQYTGRIEGTHAGPTVWEGTGTVTRDGPAINSGTVSAFTRSQLRDNDICPGQSISGSTLLASENHDVEIKYDGAMDCDDDNSARWLRNGEDQGTIKGVTCSSGDGTSGWLGSLVVLMAVLLRPRRSTHG